MTGNRGRFASSLRVAGRADPKALRRRFRPIASWQDGVDGAPQALTVRETIVVTRVGRFADRDPLVGNDAWRTGAQVLASLGWIGAIAAAAAAGWWSGHGPLAALAGFRDRWRG